MFDKTDSSGWTYNGLCDKCGKPYIYVGDVPPGGFTKGLEPYCTCNENKYTMNRDLNNIFISGERGWICPKCGKVFSPSIIECIYCNGTHTLSFSSTSDTVVLKDDDDTQSTFTDDDRTIIKENK